MGSHLGSERMLPRMFAGCSMIRRSSPPGARPIEIRFRSPAPSRATCDGVQSNSTLAGGIDPPALRRSLSKLAGRLPHSNLAYRDGGKPVEASAAITDPDIFEHKRIGGIVAQPLGGIGCP